MIPRGVYTKRLRDAGPVEHKVFRVRRMWADGLGINRIAKVLGLPKCMVSWCVRNKGRDRVPEKPAPDNRNLRHMLQSGTFEPAHHRDSVLRREALKSRR